MAGARFNDMAGLADPDPSPNSEDSSEGQLFSDGQNPLFNPVVLSELFEVCDPRDLLQIRLVCKLWYSESLPRFRKEVAVIVRQPPLKGMDSFAWIPDEEDVSNKCFHLCDVDVASLSSPPGPRRSSRGSSPELEQWERSLECEKYALLVPQLDSFWECFGRRMRKLVLNRSTVYCVDTFMKLILEKMPNLEELTIDSLKPSEELYDSGPWPPWRVDNDDVPNERVLVQPNLKRLVIIPLYDELPISWSLILRSFPNIQKLQFWGSETYNMFTNFVESLKQLVGGKARTLPLKILELKYHFYFGAESALMTLLKLPQLQLKSLEVSNFDVDVNNWMDTLQACLENHESTLETLRIDFQNLENCIKAEEGYKFPFRSDPFVLLTELNVDFPIFQDFHFLEQFPNLKKLSIGHCHEEIFGKTDLDKMKNVELIKLELFEFSSICISEELMNMFVEVMPNCESFSGPLLPASFRVICKRWTQLRSLNIVECGQELEGCSRRGDHEINDDALTGIVVGSERLPNITDLKYLRELDIGHVANITDASTRNGFLHCPLLTCLYFGSFRGSEEALAVLRKRLPKVKIHTERIIEASQQENMEEGEEFVVLV